jgi:hypothetical protein
MEAAVARGDAVPGWLAEMADEELFRILPEETR